ncbi:hypothetical protein [Vibrio phage J14]|nr:hypothetical protein [Vibrio phage J14]
MGIVDGVAKGVEQNRYAATRAVSTCLILIWVMIRFQTRGKAGQAPELPANFADNL